MTRRNILYVALFLIVSRSILWSQPCSFTSSSNLLIQSGTFEQGELTNLTTPTFSAPAPYSYASTVPPANGEYIITNNTAAWNGNALEWLDIGDNSLDSTGYMVVIHATNVDANFWEAEVELCPGFSYQFSFDLINLYEPSLTDAPQPDIQFLVNGEVQYAIGQIGNDGNWRRYEMAIQPDLGITSYTLSLRNINEGFGGAVIGLDNVFLRTCGETSIASSAACEKQNINLTAQFDSTQFPEPVFQWQRKTANGDWEDLNSTGGQYMVPFVLEDTDFRFRIANQVSEALNGCWLVSDALSIEAFEGEVALVEDTICSGATYLLGNNAFTESGSYELSLNTGSECDSLILLNLMVLEDKPMEIFGDTFLCGRDTVILYVEEGSNLLWSTGDTTSSIIINEPGVYYVYEQGREQCNIDSIEVLDSDAQAWIETTDLICPSDTNGVIEVIQVQGSYPPYTFSLDGATFQEDGIFRSLGQGSYAVQIKDSNGCIASEELSLDVIKPFNVELGDDQIVELGDSIQLHVEVEGVLDTFTWTPLDQLSCTDCLTPFVRPLNRTLYILEAQSEDGCVVADSIQVRVRVDRLIYIPNAFSPNDDGINDFFSPFTDTEVIMVEQFQIFDRWGRHVHSVTQAEPNSLELEWDGTVAGDDVESGVYAWFAEFEFSNGVFIQLEGEVLLLR